MNFFNKLKENFLKLNTAQQISVGILAICVPALIAISVNAFTASSAYMEAAANASSSEYSSETSSEAVSSESEEETSSFEESSSAEPIEIFLKHSSVEEDLEVKIVDKNGLMVTGYDFVLTVKGKDSSYMTTWTVNDGFLRLTKIDGGEYTVTISEAEGYIITEKTIECTVKEKVKYEKVDVTDKIKDETEVDVSKEDASLVKPAATPEPTPQLPSYENKTAASSTEIKKYRYRAKISENEFSDVEDGKKVGYILNRDGSKSIYIAEVDSNGFIVGDIRVLSDSASSAETSVSQVSLLSSQAVWDSSLRTAFYKSNYKIVPLNLDSSPSLLTDMDNSAAESTTSDVTICPDCQQQLSDACSAVYCTICKSHIGHSSDLHCSKCGSLDHTADAHCAKCNELGHTANDVHCSSCSKYGHADNTSSDCPNYIPPESNSTSSSQDTSSKSENETSSESESPSESPPPSESESSSESGSSSKDESSSESESSSQQPQKPSYKNTVKADVYETNSEKISAAVFEVLDLTEDHETATIYKDGWNSAKTVYYRNDGSKVTGQAIIGGTTYNFDSDGVVVKNVAKGIDVSKYQPNVNWSQVKASGVDYVIIRVGYRGYGSGVIVEDPYFKSHIAGARAAGLKVGVYFYSQAITVEEAVEEASMAIQLCSGYKLHYPIYFDTEATGTGVGRADGLSKTQRTAIANAFCQTVRNSGYKAGVYASKSWFNYNIDYDQLSQYDIWLAHYTTSTDFNRRYDMWQYTGSGSCPGISGAVDLNWAYKVY